MFYLHERPETVKRLQQELDEAIPDPKRIPSLKALETFTYMVIIANSSVFEVVALLT